jgi:hypothetical protein
MVDNSNNISTKRTITSHLKSLKTIKKTMTYGILKPSPSLGQAQNVVELNRLMESQTLVIVSFPYSQLFESIDRRSDSLQCFINQIFKMY